MVQSAVLLGQLVKMLRKGLHMATDVVIVGAGLSGLMAAHRLKEAGKTFTILDKGISVGGRLATRRIGNAVADHGTQFFTARTAEFKAQVKEWEDEGLVYVWGHGWSDGSLKRTIKDGHPRYVAKGGMNALAKHIAQPPGKIYNNTRVTTISKNDGMWIVMDSERHTYEGKVLIMTPPIPQTLALMRGVELSPNDRTALERITYGPCLCGLFVIDGDVDLPEPGAVQNFESIVYWIADNTKKGISPDERVITMHMEARYSRNNFDAPDEETLDFLRGELQQYLVNGAEIKEAQLKKWRYSVPLTTHPHDVMQAENLPVIFAGDAFGGRGRMEGAFMSGIKAGQVAIELLD